MKATQHWIVMDSCSYAKHAVTFNVGNVHNPKNPNMSDLQKIYNKSVAKAGMNR